MIKDIIFDWDGTLVDTLPFLKETFDQTFIHLKRPIMTYEQIRRLIHENMDKDMFVSVFGDKDSYRAKRFFHTYTLRNHLQRLQALSGAQEILNYCQEHNIRCHIFSNKKSSILRKEVSTLGWEKYFCSIVGAGDFAQDKPSSTACQELCRLNQIDTKHLFMLGDGPADTVSARFLGCPIAILVTKEKYIGPKPDYTLQNIQEFLPMLQTMLY